MESKGIKKLLKKQFSQILQLPAIGSFEEPTSTQMFHMLNQMGLTPPIFVIIQENVGCDPRVPTPKKANSKPKGVTIKEPSADEQPKKRKASCVLKVKVKSQSSKLKLKKPMKTVETVFNEEEVVFEIDDEEMDTKFHTNVSPQRDAFVKLNIKETSNLDVTVNTSHVDANITNSEQNSTSIPESNTVTPPEGPTSKSNTEEYSSSKFDLYS
ncbi:unnamed protein product [Lactuca virosa]|uniref:Uncharacterized protein n=1 Tax=Lactuca virosa TaxID=75947 RepID=A0AAU9M7N6_9ASTR|nr:unnamed protein product [Lactuca virosa]